MKTLKNVHQSNHSGMIVISVAMALIMVLLLNTWQVFRITSSLALDLGRSHLETIRGELEGTVNEAKLLSAEVALQASAFLGKMEDVDSFIHESKAAVLSSEAGCFNVYMAGSGWAIIPDFDMPDDYVATERDWYKGAIRSQGKPYVTAPYVDAMTGDICYTVAVMLGDKDTVLALDYTMDNIQSHIMQMNENGSQQSLIVTGDGIIAGCSDKTMIGRKLSDVFPDYSSIFSVTKIQQGFVSSRIKSGLWNESLFAAASGFGWYLIVSESDWILYKDSYLQMIGTAAITLLLLCAIIFLYLLSLKRERMSRKILNEKNHVIEKLASQIMIPLRTFLSTGMGNENEAMAGHVSLTDNMIQIRAAARQVLETLEDVEREARKKSKKETGKIDQGQTFQITARFRFRILAILVFAILLGFISNLWMSVRWGTEKVQGEVGVYDSLLTEWVGKQKSILDMFCNTIATNPQMLEDYEGTIEYLNRITSQNPEISVTYMANPAFSPSVYMNNGWTPPEGWLLEERPWYKDTMSSESGWTISAPYFDDQTGLYCVTFAERVYDAQTGRYLGTFGIDFFMDKLIDILGGSYSDRGYAFLCDINGDIINHPYGAYQMAENRSVNVSGLVYGQIKTDGHSAIVIKDYDGALRLLVARRNEKSHFVIYEAVNYLEIFGPLMLLELVILTLLIACVVMVYRLLGGLIGWQESMTVKMQEAADTAIAAGKAKSRFLAQMSHEIRTPINAVLGMNEMILRESRDEATLEYASNIQIAGKTLLTLINSILDFSKIEEGKMEIIPVEYDVSSFINNLVVSVSERAKNKGLKLIVEADESLPSVLFGDNVRLSQVITNLLTNAVKYTNEGWVRFAISVEKRSGDDVCLKVVVQDTGIGIRKEDMQRLFESFERLDEVRNHNVEGTGLGMSIVSRLLDMMGSRLSVTSVYGEGSTFSFTVIQKVVNDKPIGDYVMRLEDSRREGCHESLTAKGARVLVVDDNEMNLAVARNLLKLFGIRPDMALSGKEALTLVRRKEYHIVFMDHMMPEMDGLETLAAMRREGLPGDGTATIALTANAVNGAREMYLAAGFDGYLSKPIEVDKLEILLARYLPDDLISYRHGNEDLETAKGADDPAEEGKSSTLAAAQDPVALLKQMGYDADAGLRYVAGDTAFYLELVAGFADKAKNKGSDIRKAYEEGRIHDYQIMVHALKSSARQIGASHLSDLALKQETAAREGNLPAIASGVDTLLLCYEEAAKDLKRAADNGRAGERPLKEAAGSHERPAPLEDNTGSHETAAPSEEAAGSHKTAAPSEEAAGDRETAALARELLKKAAAYLEDFETERAIESLRALEDISAEGTSLHDPVTQILSLLDDFETLEALERLKALLNGLM